MPRSRVRESPAISDDDGTEERDKLVLLYRQTWTPRLDLRCVLASRNLSDYRTNQARLNPGDLVPLEVRDVVCFVV